ncbi:MAG: hypothetical protein JST11_12290 [Acidobacteria bacterium]|nr:hypothetical protein [Acidobacteriota bacterium]
MSDTTFERHYTIAELAEQWNLGVETVRLLVMREPDVCRVTRGKRVSYRIPAPVAQRIHNRLFNPGRPVSQK